MYTHTHTETLTQTHTHIQGTHQINEKNMCFEFFFFIFIIHGPDALYSLNKFNFRMRKKPIAHIIRMYTLVVAVVVVVSVALTNGRH